MGKIYSYVLGGSREVQIGFDVKEVMEVYMGVWNISITVIEGKIGWIKDVNIFGVKWTEKDYYFEVLNNLCKLLYIYKSSQEGTR